MNFNWYFKCLFLSFFFGKLSFFQDKRSGETVESGGCEDEYRSLVGADPILGRMQPITVSYLCEVSQIIGTNAI